MAKLYIKRRYSQIPNKLLNRKNISFKAKGLFGYLQSKPDGWSFSIHRISTQVKEGEEAINSAIKELEQEKYLQRIPLRDKEGKWKGWDYFLYPAPFNLLKKENPSAGNPSTGNLPTISNKDNSNNKYNQDITEIYSAYGKFINSRSRLTDEARKKIKTRLKVYSVEELIQAIKNFSQDTWWMQNNLHRGVAWFFHNDDRIDQFLNLRVDNKKAIKFL